MIKRDFHVHTTFCDGKSTPEELVKKAISLNFSELGLVCHAYTPCDESYCIKKENVKPFIEEVNRLKEKYKGVIKVYIGVEYDYFADMEVEDFDYVIGAVHYVLKDGKYIEVDGSKEGLIKDINEYYGGDFYAFCEDYYNTLGNIYSKVTPTFIAHFDLVTKFNKLFDLFDENNARYKLAWKNSLDKLLSKNAVFEINVGGIIRGYKDTPYPSKEQIDYIINGGGKFIVNTDSHSSSTLNFDYSEFINE